MTGHPRSSEVRAGTSPQGVHRVQVSDEGVCGRQCLREQHDVQHARALLGNTASHDDDFNAGSGGIVHMSL